MPDITPFLKSMLALPGLTGHEEPIRELIAETWRPLVDEISISPLGSLQGLRKARSNERRPSLMIATHMDAIGLMVKEIQHGLLLITNVGGIDPRILPGQRVTVHGERDLPGLIQMVPPRLLEASENSIAPVLKHLFIDTGLSEKEVSRLIKPGNLVSFAQPPFEMHGGYLAGHSLDNRASVAALTVCLEEIKNYNLDWNVLAVATTQEELNMSGAITSAFAIQPDLAVTVDVTFAKGPGSSDYRTFPLGKGPSIGVGANNHPALFTKFTALADELDMPWSVETMPASSGTDSMGIQISRGGVPTEVLGVAIRYMHTSVEMVALQDIARTGRLLARFITGLQPDSMETLFAEVKA